jgi:DNA-binding beta-propeller fold protein YncE
MHKYFTRACVTVAAGVALATVGVTGASASGTAPRAIGAPVTVTSRAAVPGAQLWAERYNGTGNGADVANAVAVSPDGATVFVTGYSQGTASTDYATVAYATATGHKLWAARYDGPAHYIDEASSVAVSPDGKTVFVTGYSYVTGHVVTDYATIAYDAATGHQLWVTQYGGPNKTGGADATSVAVSPDGATVFVTGYSFGSGTNEDYATIAYSAATGHQVWVKRYNGPGNSVDEAASLAVSPDGATVFVTGYSTGKGSDSDYATVAYSAATGQQLWVSRYNGPANYYDEATKVAVSPSGGTVFVTGYSYGAVSSSGADYATVAYNAATGQKLWLSRYDGPAHSTDQASAVAVSPDGKTVFVTGESDTAPGSGFDYATVAYDATSGHQLWATPYAGPGTNNVATAMTVNPATGTVYVTGYSLAATGGNDYATVAYAPATGHQLWASRYQGPLHQGDKALSVTASPATGTVFVTGQSGAAGTVPDYATVAYQG